MTEPPKSNRGPFHLLAKPAGPACNLACRYCFYLEKKSLFEKSTRFRMNDETLEQFTRQYIESQDGPEINFAWQGGEPTLMGLDFFRKALELQKKYASNKRITNALQTNGILIDNEWAVFLAENDFLVGLSIDGPREMHDRFRVDRTGQPTFDKVMQAMETMKKHRVEFNSLTCVQRENAEHPVKVYEFLKKAGVQFMQFIPIVERRPDAGAEELGLDLAQPPDPKAEETIASVTSWTVRPKQYGEFLAGVFDHWVRRDVGSIFVQHFDVTLANWMGMRSPLCNFSEHCGNALAIEHDGTVYSCDHYVYPDYALGNLNETPLEEMVHSPRQLEFGRNKAESLPSTCRSCDVLFACRGGCPKNRISTTPDGEPGLNFLCAGYKHFFHHIAPAMNTMAELLHNRQPASLIMEQLAKADANSPRKTVSPNDPCPCGSGKKFKKCCG